MVCDLFNPVYVSKLGGLNFASSNNDGYNISLQWDQAFASIFGNNVAYNIYFSTDRNDILTEGVKYVSIDPTFLNACIYDFPPGQTIFFIVKAMEYDPLWYNLSELQSGPDALKIYTEGLLLSDIDQDSLSIPVSDIADWPSFGMIQIGVELIRYSSKDIPTNSLIVSKRGFAESTIRIHNTDGYDGYFTQNPILSVFKGFEDDNVRIQFETSTFAYPNYAFTFADGYATNTDKITQDLSSSDSSLQDFPEYDYVGWHRTDPVNLVKGDCVGTYIGGEQFCSDGYLGVGRQTRGVPFNEQAARREEALLRTTGQKVMLIRRLWEGMRCPCVKLTNEQPELRCQKCYGTGFITGYKQFFNPRRSDGRILVRPDPYDDSLKFLEAGLESDALISFWTLGYPSLKSKDFIIRYNLDGTEEFRYEILKVNRNLLFNEEMGVQKFTTQRVRKTSPIYSWRAIADTSTMPASINTSIGLLAGGGGITIPHTHTVVVNEGITDVSQINQTTSVSAGHNHSIISGIVQDVASHSHIIVL